MIKCSNFFNSKLFIGIKKILSIFFYKNVNKKNIIQIMAYILLHAFEINFYKIKSLIFIIKV